MKIQFILGLSIVALLMGSCTTTEIIVNDSYVERVNQGEQMQLDAVDYALPRTIIDVDILAEKRVTKPGPFAAYAEKYLGVTDVPTRELAEWSIKKINLSSHAERDPEQIFRIRTHGSTRTGLVKLNELGIIEAINVGPAHSQLPDLSSSKQLKRTQEFLPEYADLTIRKNTEPMMDTIFKVVRTDTAFTRLPILKSQVSQKTLMNQAEEAASFIMKLRKRRFYLLTGEYAYRPEVQASMPDGAALEVIIRELAQLEYDYVSLFVGRTITESKTFSFTYLPSSKGLTEANDLFVFSKFRGVLPAGNSNGDPVRIDLEKEYDLNDYYSSEIPISEEKKDPIQLGFAYRIPGRAQVKLTLNNSELIEKSFPVAQYGVIQFLPVHLMNQIDIMIRFHPDLGSLDGIYNK